MEYDLGFVAQFQAPFDIKITAKTKIGSLWYYDWVEQSFDAMTGDLIDAADARNGTATDGPCLIEINNHEIKTLPFYAWCRFRGVINGRLYYEFQKDPVQSGSGSGGGGGTGSGGGGDAVFDVCRFASLYDTDCLIAVSSDGKQLKLCHGPTWTTAPINYVYPLGAGPITFWYSAGAVHCALDGLELLNCEDGCFAGGPLTGHDSIPFISGSGSGSGQFATRTDCSGASFIICIDCVSCPSCGQLPTNLKYDITSVACPAFNVTGADLGVDESMFPTAPVIQSTFTCFEDPDNVCNVILAVNFFCNVTNTGSDLLNVNVSELENLDVTFTVNMTDSAACTGNCTWLWNSMSGVWELTSDTCVGNCSGCQPAPTDYTPGTYDGQIRSEPCASADTPCCIGVLTIRVYKDGL